MYATAPVLSTPAEHIFEEESPIIPPLPLDDEQLYVQYEIQRTVNEIRDGRWTRIALQFPDEMLVHAPRVFDRLQHELRLRPPSNAVHVIEGGVEAIRLHDQGDGAGNGTCDDGIGAKLCILADTSYGACCVDEVAAEHVDAEVVVHYGRACLSPTARLPVIYVFTTKPLDQEAAVTSFIRTFPNQDERVCLLADIPYHHHLSRLGERLREEGYTKYCVTDILSDPSSLIPNRTVPTDVRDEPGKLREYSVFHISTPPTSLLLTLSSRVKSIHIYPTDASIPTKSALQPASSTALLRRRYALVTRLSTVPVFGILINTLSVSNYMAALSHVQDLITRAGKKYYVFVVGKVNAAKVANFAEIGGWVVIGCWESSLVESKDFYRPIITPFELEVALTDDRERVWGGEWVGDFAALLKRGDNMSATGHVAEEMPGTVDGFGGQHDGEDSTWDDQPSDEEPEFDLRTGRYVSQSRPMGRQKQVSSASRSNGTTAQSQASRNATPSSALVQRAKGEVALVNGAVSPAAEYLRTKRTWQGLGSDYEIAYERDAEGKIQGALMEEGRSGVAKGYMVGSAVDQRT
ncbi:hypothetical protein BAUCODRAFT_30125 [Baudoinia panamericana UAMH 10762]|uniref:2-(3-amino-3-carboxypropyl)histidine synthase subunit 2 n=1 Tax=Baudoinia panamericana (strain UAMH 10762) TaxID=717646 RepID=M2LYE3_BAUPA|nr:uncharacterized protein BAUCODRAFT_30125 [Baudoinia panamericana UAMH 10762]EMC99732.1 hypothetical protein BAUCODRAFT_30125 [Baudoinia panamericana UAMH 10762]